MGDPKFSRKKYETPTHPWQGIRISDEAEIMKKYGLKNKREVWKAQTFLRGLRGQARKLQALQGREDPQAEQETKQLLDRLNRLGLLDETARLDDVLALNMEGVLNRRLQTQVYLNGLASTPDQARQLIVHGHILVDGGRVTVPSYRVTRDKEHAIEYAPNSPLQDPEHPVRPRVELTDTSHVTENQPEEEQEEAEPEADDAEPEADEAQEEQDAEPEADEGEDEANEGSDEAPAADEKEPEGSESSEGAPATEDDEEE